METKNLIIIVALIVIVAVILVGIFATMPNMNKQDTNLTFKSKSTLSEGDLLKIKLTDKNGTPIANQTVNITITDKNNSSDYHSIVTNSKGIGTFKMDKSAGKYNVTVTYEGNDNFTGSNATKKITIKEEKVVETESTSQESSHSSDSSENDDYYNGYSRSDFSDGQQAAIDDARSHGYASPADYYQATGKQAGQAYMDAHPEEAGPRV